MPLNIFVKTLEEIATEKCRLANQKQITIKEYATIVDEQLLLAHQATLPKAVPTVEAITPVANSKKSFWAKS